MMRQIAAFLLLFFGTFSIVSAQTTVKKVVLQAYWWDYHNNSYNGKWANYLTELAPRLREMGIDAVWIPPISKNASTSSVGYAPFDHYDLGDKFQKGSVNTRMGNKNEVLRMIAVMHANGIEVIQDVVLNHCNAAGSNSGAGGQDPNSFSMANNSGFKNFRYVSYATPGTAETQTNYWNRSGRWAKNYTNFYPNPNNNCTSGDICSAYFGADISYEGNANGPSSNVTGFNPAQATNYMRDNGRNWMMWFKKQTGVDGYRWDAVKHFPTYVQEDYSWNMKYGVPSWCQGGQTMFNVGEWVASKTELDNYVNTIAAPTGEKMMGTFDFNLRAFDAAGGLYGLVYGMGGFNMASLPGSQQNERVAYYANTNTYVHRTVPFVNNHDTFRPNFGSTGNYASWNTGSELSPHIEPNEPRLSAAYAVIMALDGNPQLFFEDLFNIGYNGNRWTHDPKSVTGLPTRSDLQNLIWCHQVLDFKDGAYQVPFSNADYLVIARAGKAVIGITDSWDQWQSESVQTSFPAGTVLKDYSGANGTATVTVGANGFATITTAPVNTALNPAGRKGYSVWAPIGQDSDVYVPTRPESTTQEWEMADDLGDSNISSLGQGGAIPANSTNWRIAGKIYVQSGKTVTYICYPENATKHLYVSLTNNLGTQLSFKQGKGTLTGTYTPNFTGWITVRVRNRYATNPKQKCWVNVTYTAPKIITNANTAAASNVAAIWSGNAGTDNWLDPQNWEEGLMPNRHTDAIIPANAMPRPRIAAAAEVHDLHIEEGASLTVHAEQLQVFGNTDNEAAISRVAADKTARFSVSPNPTTGLVTLRYIADGTAPAICSARLMASDGNLLYVAKGTLDHIGTEFSAILRDAPAGTYLVALEDEVLRVVKM